MELKSITTGGPIFWRNTQVKLKNMSKGCYLELVTTYEIDDDGDVIEKYVVTTTNDSTSLGALWSVTEPNSTTKMLQNGKAYQISNSGVYLERGEETDEKNYIIKGTKEKSTALNLLVHRYQEEALDKGEEDSASTQAEPLDVHVAMAMRGYLDKYLDMTVIPTNSTTGTF